jgi:DsrE/DsrF-like family
MEVWERHARTRAVIRDTVSPANQAVVGAGDASRDVARVVSDVSVLCPRSVVRRGNAAEAALSSCLIRRRPSRPIEIGLCGSCMDTRGVDDGALVEGARRSSLEELADWTLWADKVVSF